MREGMSREARCFRNSAIPPDRLCHAAMVAVSGHTMGEQSLSRQRDCENAGSGEIHKTLSLLSHDRQNSGDYAHEGREIPLSVNR